eukprot:3371452-Prymnesium_polylepis.1
MYLVPEAPQSRVALEYRLMRTIAPWTTRSSPRAIAACFQVHFILEATHGKRCVRLSTDPLRAGME